jgi:protein-S-isoprenylcysteine O-methyltransferase Ste14
MPIRPGPAGRAVLAVGGLGLVATGLGLAIAGRVGLGASYRPSSTRGFTLAPGHRLVTSGAYGLVRHPMYLGLSLAAVGALALFRTWSTLLFVAQVPVLVVRARREDGLLASTYGDAWRRYADRVPFLFPRRPRGGADLALESVPRT